MKLDDIYYQPGKQLKVFAITKNSNTHLYQTKTVPSDSAEWPAFSYVGPTMTGRDELSEVSRIRPIWYRLLAFYFLSHLLSLMSYVLCPMSYPTLVSTQHSGYCFLTAVWISLLIFSLLRSTD
jgi:hypothetical protein